MKEHYQFIKPFEIYMDPKTTSNELANPKEEIKWFKISKQYRDFQDSFLTIIDLDPCDLWCVYEHFGNDTSAIYDCTKWNSKYNTFHVLMGVDFHDIKRSKEELESFLESGKVVDVHLLEQFKYFNDLRKLPVSEKQNDEFQTDLDDRIKHYLDEYQIFDMIFSNFEKPKFVSSYKNE